MVAIVCSPLQNASYRQNMNSYLASTRSLKSTRGRLMLCVCARASTHMHQQAQCFYMCMRKKLILCTAFHKKPKQVLC